MFASRHFLICAAGLLLTTPCRAQTNAAAPSSERPPATISPVPSAPTSLEPQITFNSVHVEGPFVAMTFDDGPNAKLTPKLLDLLAAHHMKATFFVVGENAAEYPDILKRAAREGHEIANHSWSHPNLGKMSDESARRELQKTDDAIKNAIGVRPTLMRPPYGSITAHQKRWINSEFGYRIIIWDVDPLDWKRPGPAVICNRILKETHPGSIVLAHDIHPGTIEAMTATFEQLEAKGFKFVTVSELLAMARPVPPKPKSSITTGSVRPTASPDAMSTPLPAQSPPSS
ncbi:MAG: polysaccharide deacetylase family protein [Chthoniobacterales bacterium]